MQIDETHVGTATLPRVIGCFLNQKRRTLMCPAIGSLTERVIAITGATNGIGRETAKALLDAGATVLMMVRNEAKADSMLAEWGQPSNAWVVPVDLNDLGTIQKAAEAARVALDGRVIDTLIENAGVSPQSYAETAQGHEVAFGTNVLGHFALRKQLLSGKLLSSIARIVVVTGDIYITASDCTPDFRYRTTFGATSAYSRSKLGNIWIAKALRERFPDLHVTLVHPGVVNSGLMMGDSPPERLMKRVLLPAPLGAQTTLLCVTQDVENGGYYHNIRGLVRLSEADPAWNRERRDELWALCESMCEGYVVA